MKLLVVYNIAALYRKAIFNLMEQTFHCDWLFGQYNGDIKQMGKSDFSGEVSLVKNLTFFRGKAYWQLGVVSHLFKGYSHYIFLGDERCLSTWFSICILKLFTTKKVYLWSHGVYGREGAIKKLIQKFFYGLVDGTFVYGNYARNLMNKRGIDNEKLFVIHNSLDYERQLELRNSIHLSDCYRRHFGNNNPVIVMIGRLNHRKHLDYLIDAIQILKNKGYLYNVVLIGDGEDRLLLENTVNTAGMTDQFWFYGPCYNEKTNAELLTNGDLCVVPGDIGLTAIHSLMFGVPAITHNGFKYQGPEFEAIIPGKTGDFYEYKNVDSLAQVIQKWFDSGNNRDDIRKACYKEIDTQWNPFFQIDVLKRVIYSGL